MVVSPAAWSPEFLIPTDNGALHALPSPVAESEGRSVFRGHTDPWRGHSWLRCPWPHLCTLTPPPVSHPGGTGGVYCPYSGGRGECHGRRESLRDPHGSQHPQQGPGLPALLHPLRGPGEAGGARRLGGASCRGESAIRGGGGGTGVRKGMDQSSRQGGKGQRLLQNVSANILKIQSHQSSNFKCMDSFWFPFTQKQFCLIYLLYRLYSCCASLGVMKMRWQLPG